MTANSDPSVTPVEPRVYLVYDARGQYDLDSASVLHSCDNLQEARESLARFGGEGAIYSYRIVNGEATDQRREV